MHKGVCVGGPMAGLSITTRSEVGFVAVDAAGSAAWLYYIDLGTGRYLLDLRPDPSLLDKDGTRSLDRDRALEAGSGRGLDVVPLPGDAEPAADPPAIDDGADAEGGDF